MSLLSREAQELQIGTNKTPVTPPTPTKPTAAAATTTNPSTMARKVSLEHSTATTSPESPLHLPSNGGNHRNRMMMNHSSDSATINNTHVVPPCKVSPVAQQPQCSVPAFEGGALSSCASHNKSDGNNLRDLLSQGDAYVREDSHLARLQKLHAMQVQMEQKLNQMAMEQGYFPSLHNINAATASLSAATSNNNNMGGVLGAAYSNYNYNTKFAPLHLPATMGVNGVSLPALSQLSHTQHMMNPSNFLMPKQHQQGPTSFCLHPSFRNNPTCTNTTTMTTTTIMMIIIIMMSLRTKAGHMSLIRELILPLRHKSWTWLMMTTRIIPLTAMNCTGFKNKATTGAATKTSKATTVRTRRSKKPQMHLVQ